MPQLHSLFIDLPELAPSLVDLPEIALLGFLGFCVRSHYTCSSSTSTRSPFIDLPKLASHFLDLPQLSLLCYYYFSARSPCTWSPLVHRYELSLLSSLFLAYQPKLDLPWLIDCALTTADHERHIFIVKWNPKEVGVALQFYFLFYLFIFLLFGICLYYPPSWSFYRKLFIFPH